MKKGISTLLAICLTAVVILALGAGGWYYLDKQNKEEKSSLQAQIDDLNSELTTLKQSAGTTADASKSATQSDSAAAVSAASDSNDSNLALVKSRASEFETVNAKADATSATLLAFFTPASTATEVANYNFLSGADAAAPRLKATATFSYSISFFSIDSVVKSGDKYLASVTENRVVSSNSGSAGTATKQQKKVLEFSLKSNTFLINKYYTQGVTADIPSQIGGDATAQKYEGFYTD